MKKDMFSSKTFWTGISGILTAVAGYATGGMEGGTAIQTIVTGLIGIFLKAGMIKESRVD